MSDFGRRDAGNLTVTGRLGKSRQFRLLYCRTCRDRFSERKGTPLYRAAVAQGLSSWWVHRAVTFFTM